MNSAIHELMHRDPLELTNDDLDTIISAYREARKNFINGDVTAGSGKPKSKAAKDREELKKNLKPIDLSALDL